MSKPTLKPITVSIPENVKNFIRKMHWDLRMEVGEIHRTAIVEWAKANGYDESVDYGA